MRKLLMSLAIPPLTLAFFKGIVEALAQHLVTALINWSH
jgi:hypothetical protein